jgi:hypothetical protein
MFGGAAFCVTQETVGGGSVKKTSSVSARSARNNGPPCSWTPGSLQLFETWYKCAALREGR